MSSKVIEHPVKYKTLPVVHRLQIRLLPDTRFVED